MKSHQQFFAELKRRSVFKVTAVYGAVAFGLIQVADPLADAMQLPESFVPFVVALLLLAFPIALVLAWAFELSPGGMRRMEPAAPGELEAIVAQPIGKRWPAGLLALGGVGLLITGAWLGGFRAAGGDANRSESEALRDRADAGVPRLAFVDVAEDPRPSIAVLPFTDMSPEANQAYFSDGITEEILNTLARIRELRVAARTSAFAFKARNLDLRDVADSLDVDYVVEGSVRKAGNRLRITAQLIDGTDGSHLWSEQYDRELDDVFAIQSEIAENVAGQLRVPLGLEEGERLVSPTEDLEAHDLYLAGRARMRSRGANVREAVELFEAAIARDSNWAPPWAGLAESSALLPYYTTAADSAVWASSLEAAQRAAERALELDPGNASAAVALGNVYRDRREWPDAEAAYARALSLDPDNYEAHQQYAEFLAYVGRNREAYAAALRALALDHSAIRLNVAGYIARHVPLYEEAARLIDEGIAADSAGNLSFLRHNRALTHFAVGEPVPGRQRYLEWLATFPPPIHARVAEVWPVSEPHPPAEAAERVTAWDPLKGAELWMVRGEPERALKALQAYGRRHDAFGYTNALWQALFDPIRDDPRFAALMTSMNVDDTIRERADWPY